MRNFKSHLHKLGQPIISFMGLIIALVLDGLADPDIARAMHV